MQLFIILNEEMDDITKIIKFLEESGLLMKGISETIKNKAKEQTGAFSGMFLGTLGASLLGILLTDKGVRRSKILGRGVMREGQGSVTAGEGTIKAGDGTIII